MSLYKHCGWMELFKVPLSSVLIKLQTDVMDELLYAGDKGKHVGQIWKGQR